MPKRDPRLDPAKGDVLLGLNGEAREVNEVYVDKQGHKRVEYVASRVCAPNVLLKTWRKWAANAQVVERGAGGGDA